jgi:ribosomal protein L14
MKTIAEQIKWNFETNGTLVIRNKNGNLIYFEDSNGFWIKREYDSKGEEIYSEDSDGYWLKRECDSEGNEIYFEDSNGFWIKREYDSKGNEIYFETSTGEIIDKRPKPWKDKIVEIEGVKYKLVKA